MPRKPGEARTPSLLLTYDEVVAVLGADALNEAIAGGRLHPIPLNDRPGAPSMFRRSAVERLVRRQDE